MQYPHMRTYISEADLAAGIVARVHDESHVNRFWASHPPAVVLSPAYMYPEVSSHLSRAPCLAATTEVQALHLALRCMPCT